MSEGVTEVLTRFGSGERARVAALREQGSFFWLDVSLTETSREDLSEALDLSPGALRGLPGSGDENGSRTVAAKGGSVAFTVRCYVDVGAPIEIRVVVTGDYLLTLHAEQLSLPALWSRTSRRSGAGDTSSTPCSTRCSRARSVRSTRSS